jgi:hypothetical protein
LVIDISPKIFKAAWTCQSLRPGEIQAGGCLEALIGHIVTGWHNPSAGGSIKPPGPPGPLLFLLDGRLKVYDNFEGAPGAPQVCGRN